MTTLGSCLLLLTLVGCSAAEPTAVDKAAPLTPLARPAKEWPQAGTLTPLPSRVDVSGPQVALGKRLFEDQRLSEDGRVSCQTCHSPKHGGASGLKTSQLPGRAPVPVNVPSAYNMAFNARFAWSGKYNDVGQQIDTAIGLKEAMATTWESASKRLEADKDLSQQFTEVYPEGMTPGTLRQALIQYCLSLVTPGSRFDRFLMGMLELKPKEMRGYEMFRNYGCVSCHQGINIGGNMYQRFGIMRDYFADKSVITKADLGLYGKTGREEDRHVFRVPSLRNVAETAPYFHDGSAATLESAVQTMATYQLGRELTQTQTEDIVAFLRTLTGQLQEPAL